MPPELTTTLKRSGLIVERIKEVPQPVRITKKQVPVSFQDLGLFKGDIAVKVEVLENPVINWTGGRIPDELWQKCLSFMRWTNETYNCEAQLRFFYSETEQKWDVVIAPQRITLGLASHEIGNHEDRAAAFAHLGPDFLQAGTLHHHCCSSAFQSGVDDRDELGQNQAGIHITVGWLKRKQADFHARVVLKKIQYNKNQFDIADWFENPREELLNLENLPEFPEEWKARMIKVVTAPTTYYQSGASYYNQNNTGYGNPYTFPSSRNNWTRRNTTSPGISQVSTDRGPGYWRYGNYYVRKGVPGNYYYSVDNNQAPTQGELPLPGPNNQNSKVVIPEIAEPEEDELVFFVDEFNEMAVHYSEQGFENYFQQLKSLRKRTNKVAQKYLGATETNIIEDLALFDTFDEMYSLSSRREIQEFFEAFMCPESDLTAIKQISGKLDNEIDSETEAYIREGMSEIISEDPETVNTLILENATATQPATTKNKPNQILGGHGLTYPPGHY